MGVPASRRFRVEIRIRAALPDAAPPRFPRKKSSDALPHAFVLPCPAEIKASTAVAELPVQKCGRQDKQCSSAPGSWKAAADARPANGDLCNLSELEPAAE
ncbi:uncharacterized protein VTP21DRAFT_4669 [Calcarisporiella thermophila]|uniref:uncharacterized protein n=1 Tax=Calcarisporiella thermophila TaxID=911321 RepID=UPI003743434A